MVTRIRQLASNDEEKEIEVEKENDEEREGKK